MALLSAVAQAALSAEATSILSRIAAAAEHELPVLERQFAERLGHLAERLGKEVFDTLKAAISTPTALAAPPA